MACNNVRVHGRGQRDHRGSRRYYHRGLFYGSKQTNEGTLQLSAATQQISSSIQEVSAAANELSTMGAKLSDVVTRFKV
jgi:uncharacterized phage infection (PIP) family protein YhgE